MSWRASRARPAKAAAVALALGAVGLASCGASGPRTVPDVGAAATGATAGTGAAAGFATPLATAVGGAGGTWATVPMGNLGQPVNTFWQLFFRRSGTRSWSNQVEATATATNGGLVLAPGGQSLLVGVRPSQMLTFTPLISTADAGHTWSTGLISGGLASRPAALALGPDGAALALVDGRRGTEVLESARNLSSWQTLVTGNALAADPLGRACAPGTVTAVGYLPASASSGSPAVPVIGTNCRRPGVVGIYEELTGGWRAAGPKLPAGSGQAEVVGLHPAGPGVAALVEVAGKKGTDLLAAWSSGSEPWASSAELPIGEGDHLLSFGATPSGGLFALVARLGANDELAVAGGPHMGWLQMPTPPPGTTTVAFGPGPTVEALAAGSTVLTVWQLEKATATWARSQVVHVAIQYGSSS